MGQVALLSLLAALNPALAAATTVMMLQPHPVRLMSGYLLGALLTSVTLGVVIVLSLGSSRGVSTTKNTLSPAADIALGGVALVAAALVPRAARRRLTRGASNHERPEKEPRWKRAISRGSVRMTFVIGALLTLPGVAYLAGLHQLHKLHYATAKNILVIIGFNLVMLALLEIPLVSFVLAPKWTPDAVARAKTWIGSKGPRLAARGLAVIGGLLIGKGLVGFAT